MEILTNKNKIKESRGPDSEPNMSYFKIPLCRIFHWKSEIDQGQTAYECRVQRHVSVIS